MSAKPPLPPRIPLTASNSEIDSIHSPDVPPEIRTSNYLSPSVSHNLGASPYLGGLHDPRTSSTQSLRPVESAGDNRRTLLIIYIHGFLGNETSFKSFPAHVHSLLTPILAETHVVYTKIYPQYKSRKNISFARDDFSNWLTPHESDKTDVVLVGHSLGGILAAEVVLMPSRIPGSNELYHHRILGLMAFDVPFLGVHPSVVGTGIASLFRTPPQPPESPLAESGLFTDPSSAQQDPTYNPSYSNDVHLANRKGKLQRAWYFWNKHAGEVVNAAGKYLSSHVEFGGCLADYPGLTKRYNAVRALEEVDETVKPRSPDGRLMRRVRFVNYYSASTGHVKERPPSPSQQPAFLEPPPTVLQQSSSRPSSAQALPTPSEPNPVVSLDEYREGEIITKELAELNIDPDPPEYTPMSTTSSRSTPSSATEEVVDSIEDPSGELSLPPVPDLPERPVDFDPSQYQDEDSRTRSRREHERKLKAYERAVRDRDKAIKEREKLARKRRRDTLKQQQQAEKRAKQEGTRLHKEQSKLWAPMKPDEHDERLRHEAEATQNKAQTGKKQKDRKFCTLPAKDPKTGKPDPTWVRVYMEGIDEVVAHTSMFTVGERYAKMVGDTVDRIEGWVLDDASTRVVLEGMEA